MLQKTKNSISRYENKAISTLVNLQKPTPPEQDECCQVTTTCLSKKHPKTI